MSNNDSTRLVTGLFNDRSSAERAYEHAALRGYGKDDVNLVMSDEARKRHFATCDTELGNMAAEGAGVGAGIGGALGAVLAAIAAVGTTVVLPGIGVVVAGPVAAAIAGAGAGAVTGGVLGALVGAGIPEEHASLYEEGVKRGGILMGIHARSDEDAAYLAERWKEEAGEHVLGTGVGAGGGAMAGAATGAAGGPVGMATGAAIGALAGGAGGLGVGAAIHPADEQRYWQDHFRHEDYYVPGYDYDDYGPAYALGYNSHSRYGGTWDGAEQRLRNDWDSMKERSRLSWTQARSAARAAWDRVAHPAPGDPYRETS